MKFPRRRILKQMRALGMKQRVFGSYRTLGPELLEEAGPAAEGFEAVFPYDPTRKDPRWLEFNRRFEDRFNEKPEQFASLAYDAMNALLDSICKAGLNRARIHDALADIEAIRRRHRAHDLRPQPEECCANVSGHRAERRDYLSSRDHGEAQHDATVGGREFAGQQRRRRLMRALARMV